MERNGSNQPPGADGCGTAKVRADPVGRIGIGPTAAVATVGLNVLSLTLPIMVLQIYDRVLPNAALYTLFWFAVVFVVVIVIEAILRWSRSYLVGWAAVRFQHNLVLDAAEHVLNGELATFERDSPGTHINRMQAIDHLAEFVAGESRLVVIDLCFIPLFLFVFWTISGGLVALPIALLAATGIAAFFISGMLRRSYVERAEADDRRSSFVLEVLKGLETVKLLGMEPLMLRRYERLRERTAANAYRVIFLSNFAQQMGGFISTVTMALVVVFGAKLVIDQQLSIGGLAACMMLASRAIQPPLKGFSLLSQFQIIVFAKERIREIFQIPREIHVDATNDGDTQEEPLNGAIDLRGVTYTYYEADAPLLANIDLSVAPGEYVAIRGASGVGKSTLLMLIRGLLRADEGEVLIDGRDISQWPPEILRQHLAMLTQGHVLFRGTILDNLTMFQRPNAVEDGFRAARILGLDTAVSLLPDGYDTEIRDASDIGLPDGLRQGIGVARIFAHDYRVILFDDAATCLDARVDQALVNAFRRIKGRASVVMVTRNPSLLALADRTYEIHDGKMDLVPTEEPQHQLREGTTGLPVAVHPEGQRKPDLSAATASEVGGG